MTGYRNPTPPKAGMMRKSAFIHEPQNDAYRCPQGQLLGYATTARNGYRHYTSDPSICRTCPLLASCTTSAKAQRTITRHVWAESRERTDAHRLTHGARPSTGGEGRPSSAPSPMQSNYTVTDTPRFRGLVAVATQCLLAATAQNIKKMANALTQNRQTSFA